MTGEKPKLTRTTRYLSGTSARAGFDGYIVDSPLLPRKDPRAAGRLSSAVSAKHEYDPDELARLIIEASDSLFFVDSSVFHRSTAHAIWEALFSHRESVVAVRAVRRECKPWVQSNPEHIAARALRDGHPCLRNYSYDDLPGEQQAAFAYYVRLLALRERALRAAELLFERQHGRAPREEDTRDVDRLAQQMLGARGYVLAKKAAGKQRVGFADEVVVYAAVSTAIATGRRAMILTKDEDLQEHFYKLLWLMDTHYRGMCFADAYLADLGRFQRVKWGHNNEVLHDAFDRNNALLLERTDLDLWDVLPGHYTPVPVACVVAGERLTWMEFAFETPMRRLISTKGRTGGLNTERLDPRNCHIWLAPLPVSDEQRRCAIIAKDRRLSALAETGVRIPALDANQAMMHAERF